jgi:hypothetical protein
MTKITAAFLLLTGFALAACDPGLGYGTGYVDSGYVGSG